ncbi:MAG: hypothetical protein PHI73_03580 [Patescibacteria group bacterium]|nr:hypothetical protein [Patescibacteria group bacterium]
MSSPSVSVNPAEVTFERATQRFLIAGMRTVSLTADEIRAMTKWGCCGEECGTEGDPGVMHVAYREDGVILVLCNSCKTALHKLTGARTLDVLGDVLRREVLPRLDGQDEDARRNAARIALAANRVRYLRNMVLVMAGPANRG